MLHLIYAKHPRNSILKQRSLWYFGIFLVALYLIELKVLFIIKYLSRLFCGLWSIGGFRVQC